MIFLKSKLQKILNNIINDRKLYYSGELNNIVFLDFDGVLNIDTINYMDNSNIGIPMQNLNKFCLNNEFKIIVISSWRKSPNYKEMLYCSGLDKNIKILGATGVLEKDRESEILEYLRKHTNINKFIILDDGIFNELSKFQVKTIFENGFDDNKYLEAVELIKNIDWRKYH